jgi:hypothetical protein
MRVLHITVHDIVPFGLLLYLICSLLRLSIFVAIFDANDLMRLEGGTCLKASIHV